MVSRFQHLLSAGMKRKTHGYLHLFIRKAHRTMDAEKKCILDIDVQGARSVKNKFFTCPPSFEDLEKCLHGREKEKEDQFQKCFLC
jgi:guanylate kinase